MNSCMPLASPVIRRRKSARPMRMVTRGLSARPLSIPQRPSAIRMAYSWTPSGALISYWTTACWPAALSGLNDSDMPANTLSSTPSTPPSCCWMAPTSSSLELRSTAPFSDEKSEASIWLMGRPPCSAATASPDGRIPEAYATGPPARPVPDTASTPPVLARSSASRLSPRSCTVQHLMRHTIFRFALNPTPTQQGALARHAGASRYAYNQCLRTVTDALQARKRDPRVKVPWSGFDLINSFNAWKKSEDAGRVFIAAPDGTIVNQVTGLCWRQEVSAQVFEEAALDLGHARAAYGGARTSTRGNHRVGFPKQKRKGRCRDSFRLRNRTQKGGGHLIRVGEGHPRTVRLPRIGT